MGVQVPSKEQAASVTEELRARSALPDYLKKVLASLPKDTHPMTQLSIAILALQVSVLLSTTHPLVFGRRSYWQQIRCWHPSRRPPLIAQHPFSKAPTHNPVHHCHCGPSSKPSHLVLSLALHVDLIVGTKDNAGMDCYGITRFFGVWNLGH